MLVVDIPYISDSVIEWKPYKNGDDIVSKFSAEDWHKIASDVDSEEVLQNLFEQHPDKIRGYVLYEVASSTPIAFVYILKEYSKRRTVSYHGGGWNRSPKLALLYYRGCILLIKRILESGIRVHTTTANDNKRAFKFMHSMGFVPFRKTDEKTYQWVSLKRLLNSKIYKRLFVDV